MPILRYLQHWLTGRGACLQGAAFVPDTHPLRQWAETFPWAALVAAIDRSFARRMWWSTPCRVRRGAHASMMRRRGIRPPKSPPAHRVHNREVHHPRGRAGGASPATPARPPADDAPVRPTVLGDGDSVCDTGAP